VVPVRSNKVVHISLQDVGTCEPSQGLPFFSLVADSCADGALQVFPDNEVQKGQLTMQLKRLRQTQERLEWPSDSNDLPVISWESCTFFNPSRCVLAFDNRLQSKSRQPNAP
jgi:hypothetical protein